MSLVLALIIVVAAFTVIATLIMVVLDKKKEIAVLKAMGASDGDLLRTFLYQGAIIGLIGTTIGLALGLSVCKGLLVYGFPLDPKVYFISKPAGTGASDGVRDGRHLRRLGLPGRDGLARDVRGTSQAGRSIPRAAVRETGGPGRILRANAA